MFNITTALSVLNEQQGFMFSYYSGNRKRQGIPQ